MIRTKSLTTISQRHPTVPIEQFVSIMKDLETAHPDLVFEGGLRKALKESLDQIKSWYTGETCTILNSKGKEIPSVIVLVKDLHQLIREFIVKNDIREPRIALGLDGGNHKFIVTLHVFDMSRLERADIAGYSFGGRRKSLIIAACDNCVESRANLDTVLERLELNKLEFPSNLSSDLKAANILFMIGSHTSYCPCLYCTGHKLVDKDQFFIKELVKLQKESETMDQDKVAFFKDELKKLKATYRAKGVDIQEVESLKAYRTTKKALLWSPGNMRSIRQIREFRSKWLEK